jgi:hypothetical protein
VGTTRGRRAGGGELEIVAVDIYRPDLWRDFFVMVGGGAAALTGLVFVAMSLNLDVIARDAIGLYLAAFAMLTIVVYGISGAWLLIVGVQQERARNR